ncbi:hypothetical protein [Henriciella algicola]|jgi:hypothetical protein|uniref:Uncharacterized protein n=1 Tax=Henriciella algicola TaxID=1608422 RepID=A0A399RFN0_9PROT|nr:hypothetical protein [Henriciella algicola]RIJ28675.1 hypothetical protein D1222_09830 [Henriciella algicola]
MNDQFLDDVFLPDLGIAAGLAVWGFRACARGGAGCCTVVSGFSRAFGERNGPRVLGDVLNFARFIGHSGRRKVALAMPGCARLSSDELSIIACLAAGQAGDRALMDAHLTWLMASSPPADLSDTVLAITSAFQLAGLEIEMPELVVSASRPARSSIVAVESGHA